MLLNDSSGYFFPGVFLYILISFPKILQKFITAGVLTSRVGFQLLGQFYHHLSSALADEFLRNI